MANAPVNRLWNKHKDSKRSNMNIHNSQLTTLLKMIEDLIKAMQYASGIISCINMEIQHNLLSPQFSCTDSLLHCCWSELDSLSFTGTVSALWFAIGWQCGSVWSLENRRKKENRRNYKEASSLRNKNETITWKNEIWWKKQPVTSKLPQTFLL